MIQPIEDPKFECQAALYFLEGHYLFRWHDGPAVKSKFVTSIDVAAAFLQTEQDTGWQTPGLMRSGFCAKGRFFVYSAPAGKVDLLLPEPVTVPIPRTVMLGVGSTFYMWAVNSHHFDPDFIAWNAPFPNIYNDGRICWGQNTAPVADPVKAKSIWELFFKLPFNGDLAGGKSHDFHGDVRDQLRKLAADKAKIYPVKDLCGASNHYSIGSAIDNRLEGKA